MSASSRPSVLIFATGGTIGMHQTDRGLAPDPHFADHLEVLVALICDRAGADYRINHLTPPIDSANADADTAPRIARAVRARVNTHRPRGVVITHGTDTMAYTAARLAFELDSIGCPVVLTGSQLPHGMPESDAAANLKLAITAALKAAPTAPTSIAFGGTIVPAVRAEKFQAESLTAFRAERALAPDPVRNLDRFQLNTGTPPEPARIITHRFVPGSIAADIRALKYSEPSGVVLECYGSGTAPMARPEMHAAIRELAATVPVVTITQCATGSVDASRYAVGRELATTGVIDGGDLTLEAAIAKLGFALDRGFSGEELRACMRHNLVGERTAPIGK